MNEFLTDNEGIPMRIVFVVLLCLSGVACNRTDPGNGVPVLGDAVPAPAPIVAMIPVELTVVEASVAPLLSDTCNLEDIDGVTVPDANPIDAKSRMVPVGGWLVDNAMNALPSELFVRIQSTTGDGKIWQFPVKQGLERPDVRKAYGAVPAQLRSGFAGRADLSGFTAGKYMLRLSYSRDGQLVVCDNGRSVVLK